MSILFLNYKSKSYIKKIKAEVDETKLITKNYIGN